MKKQIGILLAACMLLNPIQAFASEKTETILPSGISADKLEEQVDAYFTEHEATAGAMSIAVFDKDTVLFEKAYGYQNKETDLKNDLDAVFEWGSCTKTITWTCVMQLVEQGKIKLDEDVKTYLPKEFVDKLKFKQTVTMRDIMNHKAGFEETISDLFVADAGDVKSLSETLLMIEPGQMNTPGERTAYSNWACGLAGYIVECVSGESFTDYVHNHIFNPLGMEHTAIAMDLSDNPAVLEKRMTECCYDTEGTTMGTCFYHIPMYPAGMTTGTLGDFEKYGQAFLNKEGSLLFEKAGTIEEMCSPTDYYADGKTARNCHGFWTDQFQIPVLWHNGGTVGSTSWFAFSREANIGVVILTNQSDEGVFTAGLLSKVFGEMQFTAIREEDDCSGVYMSQQTCVQGVGKLYSMFCMMPVTKPVDGQYNMPGIGIAKTAEHMYVWDMGGKNFVIGAGTDENGHRYLETPGSDYVQIDTSLLVFRIVLLGLYGVAAIYAILWILYALVCRIRHRQIIFEGNKTLLNSATLISIILTFYIFMTLIGFGARMEQIRWAIIVNAVCMLIPVVYIVNLIRSWTKAEWTTRNRIALIVNGVLGALVTFNMLYWNTFVFWK